MKATTYAKVQQVCNVVMWILQFIVNTCGFYALLNVMLSKTELTAGIIVPTIAGALFTKFFEDATDHKFENKYLRCFLWTIELLFNEWFLFDIFDGYIPDIGYFFEDLLGIVGAFLYWGILLAFGLAFTMKFRNPGGHYGEA